MSKKVTLHATFHQLSASHCHQVGKGEGSTIGVAIGRAVDDVLGKPHVKGKRHQHIDFKVFVETPETEDVKPAR